MGNFAGMTRSPRSSTLSPALLMLTSGRRTTCTSKESRIASKLELGLYSAKQNRVCVRRRYFGSLVRAAGPRTAWSTHQSAIEIMNRAASAATSTPMEH